MDFRIVLCIYAFVFKSSYSQPPDEEKWIVSWNAPFLSSASGYGSEATSFLQGLDSTLSKQNWKIAAGLTHGDIADENYIANLPSKLLNLFQDAHNTQSNLIHNSYLFQKGKVIAICHSEPGAWSVPTPLYNSGSPCPPINSKKLHTVVGRTMFETDRLPNKWEDRINKMDEVWVPTHHHKRIFVEAGVIIPIQVVGQGIDVNQWNPYIVDILDEKELDLKGKCNQDDYKFLSVFKWEARKGHDILLPSFFKAFPGGKGACLIIVTSLYHLDQEKILNDIQKYWIAAGNKDPKSYGIVLISGLSTQKLIRLYKSVDAFVLPSRGEGWGRPYMEAMSMELPVIATNWSGPTEFVSDRIGYLLPIRGLVDANIDAFPGHKWADPDPEKLEYLLKYLKENPVEAKRKGQLARKFIVEKWSNVVVSKDVMLHLERLARVNAKSTTPDKVEL